MKNYYLLGGHTLHIKSKKSEKWKKSYLIKKILYFWFFEKKSWILSTLLWIQFSI